MKAKFVYESVDDILVPKTSTDIMKNIKNKFDKKILERYVKNLPYLLDYMKVSDFSDEEVNYVIDECKKIGNLKDLKLLKVSQIHTNILVVFMYMFNKKVMVEKKWTELNTKIFDCGYVDLKSGYAFFGNDDFKHVFFVIPKDFIKRIYNNKVTEGVADTYAEKFGIYNTTKHEDERAMVHSIKDEENILVPPIDGVYPIDFKVIVNPSSINNIPPEARGLIDVLGNLYFSIGYPVTHSVLINFLEEQDIIEQDKQWNVHIPEDFLTVQRFKDTNIIAVGESNLFAYPIGSKYHNNAYKFRSFTEKDKNDTIEYFFKKAKLKNPLFKYVNKVIDYLYHES